MGIDSKSPSFFLKYYTLFKLQPCETWTNNLSTCFSLRSRKFLTARRRHAKLKLHNKWQPRWHVNKNTIIMKKNLMLLSAMAAFVFFCSCGSKTQSMDKDNDSVDSSTENVSMDLKCLLIVEYRTSWQVVWLSECLSQNRTNLSTCWFNVGWREKQPS